MGFYSKLIYIKYLDKISVHRNKYAPNAIQFIHMHGV